MLKSAAAYFGLVFTTGFVLGIVRTLWLLPALGERNAELVETPFMLLAVFLAARFVTRRARRGSVEAPLGIGLLALGLMLAAELGVVLFVRQQELGDYVASRDPVSGTVYLVSLAFFALAPAIVARGHTRT